MDPCKKDPCAYEFVPECPPCKTQSGGNAFTRMFSCFSQPGNCDEPCCELAPPDECPVECTTPEMRRATWLHMSELVATILLIIVGSLAATGNLGNGKDANDPNAGYYIGLEPQSWVQAFHIVFWIMLFAGTSVAIRTAYRSPAVSYVLVPCYSVILGILLWAGAVFAWIYESTHIAAFVLVLVAALLFHFAMHRLYATHCQVPSTMVYAFWISAVAFAAGWSLYVATFLFDTVLTAQELDLYLPGQTAGSVILAAIFLGAFATIWSLNYYSFIYAGIVAIGAGASLGGNLDRGKGVGNDLSITLIITIILLGIVWLLSFYKRIISNACQDGGMMFVGSRFAKVSRSPAAYKSV